MKNILAKEYLNQFITMQLEIKRKRMRLEILKETATDISVYDFLKNKVKYIMEKK